MPENFLDVGIETDEAALGDLAIAQLQGQWPAWVPSEGDLEVVQIEVLAAMAADAAVTASKVPGAVFRAILTKLHGIAYSSGTRASTTVTFTLTDTAAHVIPAGTEIDIDGYAFTTNADVATAALTAPNVPVTASVIGADANGLTGVAVILVSSLAFVQSVAVNAVTAGGADPESDELFADRGSREMELIAKTLVIARDYELMTLSQTYVTRVVTIANQTTREITVYASGPNGAAVSAANKTILLALLNEYRMSNWNVIIGDATTTVISVTYSVHPYPGQATADLLARINAELTDFLNVTEWGRRREFGDVRSARWLVETRVRKNKVIDLIGSVAGVDYVDTVTLSAPSGTLQGNGDWLMTGVVPLAATGTLTGSVV